MLLLLACAAAPEDPIVTTFALNVHDWVFVHESAATVERVLDLHEDADVPVDIFLTDPVARAFREEAPYVLDRLRDSPVAAVSYHVRPPHPYYPGFDWYGFAALDADARYAVLAQYESHAVDLETGETRIDAGGASLLEELVGYAPLAAGPSVSPTLSVVYADLGIVFGVDHDEAHDLGEGDGRLWTRPEHVEVKLYEYAETSREGCEILEAHVAEDADRPASGPRFVNVKWHENDLYARGSAWKHVYYADADDTRPLSPPWSLDAWTDDYRPMPETQRVARWDLYAEALDCVYADRARWAPANLRDVAALLEGA